MEMGGDGGYGVMMCYCNVVVLLDVLMFVV